MTGYSLAGCIADCGRRARRPSVLAHDLVRQQFARSLVAGVADRHQLRGRFPLGYRLNVAGNVTLGGGGTMRADMAGDNESRLTLCSRTDECALRRAPGRGRRPDGPHERLDLPRESGTNGPTGSGKTNSIVGDSRGGYGGRQGRRRHEGGLGGYSRATGTSTGPGPGGLPTTRRIELRRKRRRPNAGNIYGMNTVSTATRQSGGAFYLLQHRLGRRAPSMW